MDSTQSPRNLALGGGGHASPENRPAPAVLIASPGAALRGELREKLDGSCPIHEVSQWDSIEKTVSSLLPDVVLLDVDLLRLSGIDDLTIIQRISGSSRVVLLTASPSEAEGVHALAAGARGYCRNDLDGPVLRKVVDRVRDGEVWAERRLIPLVLQQYTSHPERRPEARSGPTGGSTS